MLDRCSDTKAPCKAIMQMVTTNGQGFCRTRRGALSCEGVGGADGPAQTG